MTIRAAARERCLSAAVAVGLAFTVVIAGYVATPSAPAAASATPPAFSATKTITRDMAQADGTVKTVDSKTVTVNVDRTTDLKGRESVNVSWSGAKPTSGLKSNLFSQEAQTQEYPVVILLCRGRGDDPTLPADQQPDPESCWLTQYPLRTFSRAPAQAVWTHDLYASDSDRASSVPAASEWPAECPVDPGNVNRLIPFIAANGTKYWACSTSTETPEMSTSGSAGLPPDELAAPTRVDGTGTVPVEIRTFAENQSLGCSASVPCSIVVIPIMGISCLDGDAECVKTAHFAPGAPNGNAQESANLAVEGAFWWSASNWRNRFVVPITIAPSPDVCDILDPRAPVPFYGSELFRQVALQWAPAYCLSPDRFKFQAHDQPESTAFSNLRRGKTTNALVTYPGVTGPGDPPIAYAPVAVSGFAVAFNIDVPGGGGPLTHLRLTPRLLAKLMTGSYFGTAMSASVRLQRPDLANNPLSMNLDPEFLELNPVMKTSPASLNTQDISWASLVSLSTPSDVMTALTGYIASDPEAATFLHGTPDPWGMTVNAAYKDIALPRNDWPLLDTWLPAGPAMTPCEREQPLAWFNRILAPVSSMDRIAGDILSAWPESIPMVTGIGSRDLFNPCKFVRMEQQNYGSRHVLGLVALGDAERYGLPTAALRTNGTGIDARFVAPDVSSMAAAVQTATSQAPGRPFLIDPAALRAQPDAYPGTMVVSAAVPLTGLDPATASHIAQFIRVATTEGQVPGVNFGQLAPGYLPLTASGPTAPLFASAQVVAEAIRVQAGPLAAPAPTPQPSSSSPAPSLAASDQGAGAPASAGPPPGSAPVPTVGASTTSLGLPAPTGSPAPPAARRGTTDAPRLTGVAAATLPAALGIGALGLIGAPLLRQLSTRRPRG
jgi:hypothetical protein